MENPEIAQIFEEIADLLEIQNENPFRVRAYRRAARTIRDLPKSLVDLVAANGRELEKLPGIGKDLAEKISTIVKTGDLVLRQELRRQVPPSLRDLLGIAGLGPKHAKSLYEKLHIQSLDQLRTAAEAHRLQEVRGFGAKTEAKILAALRLPMESANRRYLLDEAKVYAESIERHLKGVDGLEQITVAGSYRRHQETVGDLDILVACSNADRAMDRLANYDAVATIVERGSTKMSVNLKTGMQVDLRVVKPVSFGAALQYFTGSKQHNILVRNRAQKMGLKINEYGVFQGARRIAGAKEIDVYSALNLPWIPPELRTGGRELELASAGALPMLVELDQIRGDLHMHTNATDGRATLNEMIEAAARFGYSYIAITDHSKRVTMAKGLDSRRLREQWKKIDALADNRNGIRVLKGVELDILEDGSLDLPDEVLCEADWVVASIHYGQNQSRDQITRRILNAIRNPHVHAIGHPTGRMIGKREPYQLDLVTVLKAAADYGCCMELNCQPVRLDLSDVNLQAAHEFKIPIVLGTDAHAVEELRFMEFGIWQARRAGLTSADIVNTRPWAQFKKLLTRKRSSRVAG